MLGWISDNKILPAQNIFSVILNPREQKYLCNSVVFIDFDQTAKRRLENIAVVIIDPPLIDYFNKLSRIERSGRCAVKGFIVCQVCGAQDCKSDRKYLGLDVFSVIDVRGFDQWHILGRQVGGLIF
jgi:hypothetical protein